MGMARFLVGTAVAGAASYIFATWAQSQSDQQVNKMQLSAYNTPGAEAPVPPAVLAAGMSTLSTVWFLQRKILRQSWSGSAAAILLGAALGVAAIYAIPKLSSS